MSRYMRASMACLVVATLLSGCIDPKDARPGLALSGDRAEEAPADWSFTDAHPEIAIQVATPYWIPHSVTIWCGSVGGELFLAARDPETKRWPGWVERDPEVVIRVGGKLYGGTLSRIEEGELLTGVRAAYAAKYERDEMPPNIRYWRFVPEA